MTVDIHLLGLGGKKLEARDHVPTREGLPDLVNDLRHCGECKPCLQKAKWPLSCPSPNATSSRTALTIVWDFLESLKSKSSHYARTRLTVISFSTEAAAFSPHTTMFEGLPAAASITIAFTVASTVVGLFFIQPTPAKPTARLHLGLSPRSIITLTYLTSVFSTVLYLVQGKSAHDTHERERRPRGPRGAMSSRTAQRAPYAIHPHPPCT